MDILVEPKSRIEAGTKEIKDIIKQISKDGVHLNMVTGENLKISCKITKIEADSNSFQITVLDKGQIKYMTAEAMYDLGFSRDGTTYNFMTKCRYNGPNILRMEIPHEVKITDQRQHKRIDTLSSQNPYIEVGVAGTKEKFLMNDLSQGGLSFFAPKRLSETFKPKQIIQIHRIGKQTFKEPMMAEIRHISEVTVTTKPSLKIGIRFLDKPEF